MDAVPVIVRGHNVAVLVPPVVEAVRPLLAAVTERRLLILTPDTDRAVVLAEALEPGFASRNARLVAVSSLQRGAKHLAAPHDAVCVGVADALALLQQSALKAASYGAVALAWPEQAQGDARPALEAVMAEVDKEAQRILLAAEADAGTAKLIERYAFKAMTFGFPPTEPEPGTAPEGPVGAARYVIAPASRCEDVRRRVLDALAPDSDDAVVVATAPESRVAAQTLVHSAGVEPPVIVAEPYQLPWLRRLFAPLTPLPVAGAADAAERRAEAQRRRLAQLIEDDELAAELLELAPLLRQHDAALVAAAVLRLSRAEPRRAATAAPAAPTAGAGAGGFAKLWVGIGRKDNVRPGDLIAALANQAHVSPESVGRIEVRDLFCLVEIRADQAERAVKGLTGVTVKGRRIIARVDQGPGAKHRPPRRV